MDYVRSNDYDSSPTNLGPFSESDVVEGGHVEGDSTTGVDKIGMAVIINRAPLDGGASTWDYTLRLNYTYGVSMFEDQVTRNGLFVCTFGVEESPSCVRLRWLDWRHVP